MWLLNHKIIVNDDYDVVTLQHNGVKILLKDAVYLLLIEELSI